MHLDLADTKKIAYILAIIGITALILLLPEERQVEIAAINESSIGEKVSLSGSIANLKISSGNAFFDLENNGIISAAYFSPTLEQASILKNGSAVKATGQITRYNEKLEIIVKRVEEID
ncbi:MAG: exodeoxyribonuclease VII large subunit [archaeon]